MIDPSAVYPFLDELTTKELFLLGMIVSLLWKLAPRWLVVLTLRVFATAFCVLAFCLCGLADRAIEPKVLPMYGPEGGFAVYLVCGFACWAFFCLPVLIWRPRQTRTG